MYFLLPPLKFSSYYINVGILLMIVSVFCRACHYKWSDWICKLWKGRST